MHIKALTITTAASVLAATAIAQPPVLEYQVIRIGPVLPDDESYAAAMNELGQVAGSTFNTAIFSGGAGGYLNTAVWLPQPDYGMPQGGNMIECPWRPDENHRAWGINDLGQMCGFAGPPSGEEGWARAYRWDPDTGTMVNLGYLGSNIYAEPHSNTTAINNNGYVVGYSSPPPGTDPVRQFWHPFLHDGIQMTDLGTFGGVYGRALDINDQNQVVGFATYRNPDAPVWDPLFEEDLSAAIWLPEPAYGLPAGLTDLTPAPEVRPATFGATAEAINEHGEVAISFPWVIPGGGGTYRSQVALWLPEPNYGLPAGLNVIGFFNDEDWRTTSVLDINNNGWMIGRYLWGFTPGGLPIWHSFLYANGQWYDLDDIRKAPFDLSWNLEGAMAINDAGEITGFADHSLPGGGVEYVAFMLVPIRPCVGDLDDDGYTNVFDFSTLAANFGTTSLARRHEGDIDRDGDVDVFDFGLFSADFGCQSLPD